jgi:hypothetical protein
MHLQQTKRGSRDSGGPQYYLHDLTPEVRKELRKRGKVAVALVTPYGATKSDYVAVDKDRKLNNAGKAVPGHVGHDRIQQGDAAESLGESIRKWYMLPHGDFEKISVQIEVQDRRFYVRPLDCKYADSGKIIKIPCVDRPLTFTLEYRSPFWLNQMVKIEKKQKGIVWWCIEEFRRIVKDHAKATRLPHIQETDILRSGGPLRHLGVTLGGYVGKGYDCKTEFQFLDFLPYIVPVELKRNSLGFQYQQAKYGKDELSRAVVLCATHSHKNVPSNIDVIELEALARFTASDLMAAK